MEHLNSVLLEGIVISNPVRNSDYSVRFEIESVHYWPQNRRSEENLKVLRIPIETTTSILGEKVLEMIRKRMKVRVVGVLLPDEDNLVIVAEYIEHKNLRKRYMVEKDGVSAKI